MDAVRTSGKLNGTATKKSILGCECQGQHPRGVERHDGLSISAAWDDLCLDRHWMDSFSRIATDKEDRSYHYPLAACQPTDCPHQLPTALCGWGSKSWPKHADTNAALPTPRTFHPLPASNPGKFPRKPGWAAGQQNLCHHLGALRPIRLRP